MSNPFNSGIIVGNAASAPKLFPHANGTSATVKLSVFARNNFVNKQSGAVESEVVELTGYVADVTKPGVFAHIGKGDRVAVSYSLKTDRYTDKNGVEHFPLVARIDSVQMLDSKAESAARAAKRDAQAQAQAPTQPQAQAQPVAAGDPPF